MQNVSRKEQILTMLVSEPNDVFLNYALAMEYIATYNFKEAEEQLKNVLLINPSYLPCFYQLGQVYEKLNLIDMALNYYKQGIDLAKLQNNNKALGELTEAIWMLED